MKYFSALASLAVTVGTAEAFSVLGPSRGHHILSRAVQSSSTTSSSSLTTPYLSKW